AIIGSQSTSTPTTLNPTRRLSSATTNLRSARRVCCERPFESYSSERCSSRRKRHNSLPMRATHRPPPNPKRSSMSDERICLIDMDDTLYDYAGQLRRDLEALQSPSDPPLPEDLFRDPEPWLRRRIDVIRRQPGWWLNLPRLKLGWDIYEVAVQIGYTVEILSKGPFRNARAWAEKV